MHAALLPHARLCTTALQPGRSIRDELEIELSNDSQPEAAPAQRAKQVGVPIVTHAHYFAVSEHDLGREQIIAGQSVFSYQPADPAA